MSLEKRLLSYLSCCGYNIHSINSLLSIEQLFDKHDYVILYYNYYYNNNKLYFLLFSKISEDYFELFSPYKISELDNITFQKVNNYATKLNKKIYIKISKTTIINQFSTYLNLKSILLRKLTLRNNTTLDSFYGLFFNSNLTPEYLINYLIFLPSVYNRI